MSDGPGITIILGRPSIAQGVDHAASRIAAAKSDRPLQPKGDVNYRAAEGKSRCGSCAHFTAQSQAQEKGSCSVVAGTVEVDQVSDLYEPRSPDRESPADAKKVPG